MLSSCIIYLSFNELFRHIILEHAYTYVFELKED